MKGSLNIKVTNKNGDIKYNKHLKNTILPTFKHKTNSYLRHLSELNNNPNSSNYNKFPSLLNVDTYGGITLHDSIFDTSSGVSDEYFDIEYKIPFLTGGSNSRRDESNKSYVNRSETSEIQDIYDDVNKHYLTNTWLWNSDKEFTLRSVTLKDATFINLGFNFNNLGGGPNITFNNDYFYKQYSYGSDFDQYIYYKPDVSIQTMGKIYKNCYELYEVHPLYKDYVVVPYRTYSNGSDPDATETGYRTYCNTLAIFSYDNLDSLRDYTKRSYEIDLDDLDSSFFDHSGDFGKGFYFSVVSTSNYDYFVFTKYDERLIKIYRYDVLNNSIKELSDDAFESTIRDKYAELQQKFSDQGESSYSAGYMRVIGNVVHMGDPGNSTQSEIKITDSLVNDEYDVNFDVLVGYFYNGDNQNYTSKTIYLYRNSKNIDIARDDFYCPTYVTRSTVYGNNNSYDVYYKTIPSNHDMTNQTYVNLQQPVSIDEGDKILISYTISLGEEPEPNNDSGENE